MTRLLALLIGSASFPGGLARPQCPDGSPPPCRVALASVRSPASVAVLYLDNASHDSADAYLAEGLTEAVITQLGRVERLSVMSRSAVRRYRGAETPSPGEIGRTLNVAYLVTGSLQRSGGQLRVTIELARTTNGVRVWGDQFVRADDSLFVLQDDIARRVAEEVAGRLLPAERRSVAAIRVTRNPEAYEHLLRGNYYLAQRTSPGLAQATTEYRRAAALDSTFVTALARVGLAYALRLDWAWDSAGAPPAESLLTNGLAAADQALRRDSLNSDAWLARGYLLQFRNPRTWEGVLPALERATALDPRNAEAWHQLADAAGLMRDDSTAVIGYRRAMAIDPARPVTLVNYAMGGADPSQAGRLLDSAVTLDPGYGPARSARSVYRLTHGDTAGARLDLANLCDRCTPEMRTAAWAWYASGLADLGDTAAAREEAERVIAKLAPADPLTIRVAEPLARYYSVRGDTIAALDFLERTTPRGVFLWNLLADNVWQPVSQSSRFRRILVEATPPWAPSTPDVLDRPIPATALTKWEGDYTGPLGPGRLIARGDSLLVELDHTPVGRLPYQGGDAFIASWDHATQFVFDAGSPVGFTVLRRKRLFPYKRAR